MEKANKNDKEEIKKNKAKLKNKKELGKFLKEHVIKKIKVLSIIGVVLVILVIAVFLASDFKVTDEIAAFPKTSILSALKERLFILLLILLAGWVPYFYIPAIAYIAYIFMLSGDLLFKMELHGKILTLVLNILPLIIDIFTVSIITAIGIYMCNYTTKKYRFTQSMSFSFLDVKLHLYEITKKQDKYDEVLTRKEKKIADMQKNDVKIDYRMILKIAPIIVVINLIVCLIQNII